MRQNTKPQHAKLFRALFEQSKDPEVRKAAIEGLGNDPDSIDLLEKTVLNDQESFKIREAGALSLHHVDSEKMNGLAARLLTEPVAEGGLEMLRATSTPDPDEVNFKAGLLNMLAFTEDIGRLRQDKGLKASLEQVVDKGAGERSDPTGSLEGLSNLDAITDETSREPTIIEQMAAKVLKRFEASDDDE